MTHPTTAHIVAWPNWRPAAVAALRAMLAEIGRGTRLFGTQDDTSRRRTIDFLAQSGLLAEAYGFLPPLAEARAAAAGVMTRTPPASPKPASPRLRRAALPARPPPASNR